MNREKNYLENLIERANKMEWDALEELKYMFYDYTKIKYWLIIGNTYGNQYFDDYISKVIEVVLKSIKDFEVTSRNAFCVYVNKCINSIAINFYRDHIKYKHVYISLDELFQNVNLSNYHLSNGNIEDLVVSKITEYEIIFIHTLPGLPNAEKAAVLRKINSIETIKEYAKRVSCSENTIRAHESKAIKKMKEKAAAKKLKELYHL